ncbi:MAG: ABC transporter permease subunit [Caldilineaceae bacterium]
MVTSKAPKTTWNWLGLLPFFIFAIAFLLIPSASLFIDSFRNNNGQFTFDNILNLSQPPIPESYSMSIRVSAFTALLGGIIGFLLAYAITIGGLPGWVKSMVMTFSGVASNFAGVPLAFAFISILGRTGLVTVLLKGLGIDLYNQGFSLYSFLGLSLCYTYFQFPLMVLIMVPAIEGLRREWREAAENLGASSWQYWRYVGLPILLPSVLATMILLFGNSFGAYATALSLTGGRLPLVTIQIGAQIRGDVLHNANLGYAMALGMVVIMAICILTYTWLQRWTERWVKQ